MSDCLGKILFFDSRTILNLLEKRFALLALDKNQRCALAIVHTRRFFLYAPEIGQGDITGTILLAEVAAMARRTQV